MTLLLFNNDRLCITHNWQWWTYLAKINSSFSQKINFLIWINFNPVDNDILTLEDVAGLMKVSQKTVYRWVAAKKLRAAKIGHKTYRVLKGDLMKFINDHIN